MKLRFKVLLIALLLSSLTLLGTGLVFEHFMLNGFKQAELVSAQTQTKRCRDLLQNMALSFERSAKDYAFWDDMYAFIRSGDPEFVRNNLGNTAFQNLEIDAIHISDSDNREIFSRYVRHETLTEMDAGFFKATDGRSFADLLSSSSRGESQRGFIRVAGGLLMVARVPVSDSENILPSRGWLTFGKFIEDREQKAMSRMIHQSFQLNAVSPAISQKNMKDEEIRIDYHGSDSMTGIAAVSDISGVPVASLRVPMTREYFKMGRRALNSALVAIAIGAFLFMGFFLVSIEYFVLRSVRRMISSVQLISSGRASSSSLPESEMDELGKLSSEFNALLKQHRSIERDLESRVEDRTRQLRAVSDDLLLAGIVFDHISDAIMITDNRGRILRVNPAFSIVTEYASEEVVGRSAAVLKSGRHGRQFFNELWQSLKRTGYWSGEIWNRRKSGEVYPALLAISPLRDESGHITHYVASQRDISIAKAREDRILYLAYHDALTGLPNRALFIDRLDLAIAAHRRSNLKLIVLFLDLDGFKKINDSRGHGFGDQLLIDVTRRLNEHTRDADTIARQGGDEFLVMCPGIVDELTIATIADRILAALFDTALIDGHEVTVSASIGISCYPDDGDTAEALIKNADIAMYHAKEGGRNKYRIFCSEMNDRVQQRLKIESNLRVAIADQVIQAWFQPRYDLTTRRIRGAEALARWPLEGGGMLPPCDFIPVAEETGLIVPLGKRMLQLACAEGRKWLDAGCIGAVVSVNVSIRQLFNREFIDTVKEALAESSLPPESLELEITESVFIRDFGEIVQILRELSSLGVRFAIDDFGTGYSSLSYLRQLPINVLKIDRSFVSDLEGNRGNRTLIDTILSMAEALGMDVVAEGLETAYQETYLREHSCRAEIVGQGFLFGRPMPASDFNAMLLTNMMSSEVGVSITQPQLQE